MYVYVFIDFIHVLLFISTLYIHYNTYTMKIFQHKIEKNNKKIVGVPMLSFCTVLNCSVNCSK